MFARVLTLSLCLVVSLHATMIETPPVVVDPPISEEVTAPLFQLNLSSFLALAFTYTYGSFYDNDEQDNVTEVITPMYQAWLDHLLGRSGFYGPGIDQPGGGELATSATSLTVVPTPLTPSSDPFAATSVPEPATWWLAAAGTAWVLLRRSRT